MLSDTFSFLLSCALLAPTGQGAATLTCVRSHHRCSRRLPLLSEVRTRMDASGSPSQLSPRSIRSDLVRSFTTSSDTSASERVAALREARALRRRQREGDADLPAKETENDVDAGVIERPNIACAEETPPVLAASAATPRLRVEPTSDGSYSPSLPSTPSNSKPRTTATSESDSGNRDRGFNYEMVRRFEVRLEPSRMLT